MKTRFSCSFQASLRAIFTSRTLETYIVQKMDGFFIVRFFMLSSTTSFPSSKEEVGDEEEDLLLLKAYTLLFFSRDLKYKSAFVVVQQYLLLNVTI